MTAGTAVMTAGTGVMTEGTGVTTAETDDDSNGALGKRLQRLIAWDCESFNGLVRDELLAVGLI